jgi:CTP:molybdopterin cytidylyltransferase MocA/RimJ/RimL family protein N-acetyltransferase
VHAIVLAAGASTRMGRAKALTPIDGEPAVSRTVRVARACGLDTVVVTRAGVALPPLDARVVVNERPDDGRTGSLQVGLRASGTREALVWPVDHPLAREATVRALLAARGDWVLPTHLGRSGHPIVVRGRAVEAILRAAPATPLRAIPPTIGLAPERVRVDDAGVLANLDTPQQVAAALGAIRLEPWGPGDRELLRRLLGDPRMMTHLGGPESPSKLDERQARYERMATAGPAAGQSLKIVLDGSRGGVGWVGYWAASWRGEEVYEVGWAVVPEHQGRGIATRAVRQLLQLAGAQRTRRWAHAFPSVDNAPSNALCRAVGFELLGPVDVEYPPGTSMRCNDWRIRLEAP